MGRLVAVLAACLLLSGCSDWPPYAVRLGPTGGVEIVYANCGEEAEKLVRIAFVVVEGDTWDEDEPKIWQLDFVTPTPLSSVETGRTPEGAVETVPWQQPAPDQEVHVEIAYEQRPQATTQMFTLAQLSEGKTLYRGDWVSREEFDARCE
ncbi:hypothetical protein ACSHWB_18515 [Lentzea sp. HUAS TT2]|uniref:hypothetical protein n=1 Tax=Lentzea sp. HUAS TT2 TaxID=3447454 RepID=UPI003F6EB86F